MKQWHPIFAQLLRPAVEGYYEVQTTVPVGDAPREADFVLLRRTTTSQPPFRGLWRHLTVWNILEFKGPTVSPRHDDVELLVELGLGIDRKLRAGRRRPAPAEVSFWYLANRLGQRFLRSAEERLGPLELLGPGLWRCKVLGRLVFWVSSSDLPVEEDSLPLHVVGIEPPAVERQVAEFVVGQPKLLARYGGWLAGLHPEVWKEVEAMARTAKRELKIDLGPAIESLGIRRVLEQVGIERVIEAIGRDRVIEAIGRDRVIEAIGEREVIQQVGLDRWLANLTPAERRELKRRLQ